MIDPPTAFEIGRHTVCDAGSSEAEIKAVTGYQTAKEVDRHTNPAIKSGWLWAAFDTIGGTQPKQILAEPESGLAKMETN